MAKKKESSEQAKPKVKKGIFLSDVAMKEIDEVLAHYEPAQQIELAEHLRKIFKEVGQYFKTNDEAVYNGYVERQDALLTKYGKLFKPFAHKRFDNYFDFTRLLSLKDYYTAEEYNQLASNVDLSQLDINELTTSMNNFLSGKLHFLRLDMEPQFEVASKNATKEEDDTGMTEARQLLAIYYLLKSTLSIEHRSHGDVTTYARFAHLLLGKKFSKMADSSIYKKYKKLPNVNKGKQLISDLEYIKPYFQQLNLQKAIDLIDKEIADENNSDNH